MANHQIIRAPEGTKYLKEVLTEGTLPKNCIFDKVLTGCGGSYVALTSPEPYIIAVPTKSLVRDKVTSEQYKPYKIQGVSEDYPLGKRRLYLFDKIIVTYKSLPKVAEKVDISKYNLLIDEMHMLATMTGYARQELSWILNNFKSFKSYCFMSATVPRSEHLLEELKDLPVVGIEWSDIARVDFECLLSSNVTSSLLRVLLEHQRGERVGTPYVFYNSVSGICDIVSRWKNSKIPARFNIICADTKANIKRLKEVREDLGKPNRKADFHFITATAFEGVDFYDPDGVTYIISNNLYYSTKYSIETTIPQIVGRLRDSKFNRHITLIYNQHAKTSDMSPREFSKHLDQLESNARSSVSNYQNILELYKTDPTHKETLMYLLKGLIENPNVLVEGQLLEFEDLLAPNVIAEEGDNFPQVHYYPYARTLMQQTYDLLNEERYVRGEETAEPVRSLASISGSAPLLSDEDAKQFKIPRVGLDGILSLYHEDPFECQALHPEWYAIIEKLTPEVCQKYSKNKSYLKKLYKTRVAEDAVCAEDQVSRIFQPGNVYTAAYIKEYLQSLNIPNAKATTLGKWYVIKRVTKNGVACYRIISRLVDNL